MADDLLNATETARALGLSQPTTLKHLRDGTIPAARIGRSWRVSQAELDKMMLDRSPKPDRLSGRRRGNRS